MNIHRNLCMIMLICILILIVIYQLLLNQSENAEIKYNTRLNLTNPEFLKIKNYIDKNTAKLKIYIGDFQSDVNDEALIEVQNHNFGHGQIMARNYNSSKISMYCGDMSMDFIFYDRLIKDKDILVDNVNDANVVYIPVMLGSLFGHPNDTFQKLFHNMSVWLEKNEEIFRSKLVVLIFSHLESILHYNPYNESAEIFSQHTKNLYVFTIEESYYRRFNYLYFVTPYPSITKFQLKHKQTEYNYPINNNRVVDVFFSGNSRKWNAYRKFIFENIEYKTNMSFDTFKKTSYKNYTQIANTNRLKNQTTILSVIYHLGFQDHGDWMSYSSWPDKVKGMTEATDWKRNSKLCLEPFGDTPTRRSFWDSIIHGCIPVVFTNFTLPFTDHIDYSKFVVHIDKTAEELLNGTDFSSLFLPYLNNKKWMHKAKDYIKDIRQFIQYSWPYDDDYYPVDPNFRYDAYGMILAKLGEFV